MKRVNKKMTAPSSKRAVIFSLIHMTLYVHCVIDRWLSIPHER
jgi:hypothetical protein